MAAVLCGWCLALRLPETTPPPPLFILQSCASFSRNTGMQMRRGEAKNSVSSFFFLFTACRGGRKRRVFFSLVLQSAGEWRIQPKRSVSHYKPVFERIRGIFLPSHAMQLQWQFPRTCRPKRWAIMKELHLNRCLNGDRRISPRHRTCHWAKLTASPLMGVFPGKRVDQTPNVKLWR